MFTVSPGLMFIDGIHGDGNGRVYLLLSCLMHLVRWQEYETVTWKTGPKVSDISRHSALHQHPSPCPLMCSVAHGGYWTRGGGGDLAFSQNRKLGW